MVALLRVVNVAGGREAIASILSFLDHDNPMIRRLAIETLGEILDPSSLDYLLAKLDDHDIASQQAAVNSISSLSSRRPRYDRGMRSYASVLALVATLGLTLSCAHAPALSEERQIDAALQRYAQRVVAMDPPGIAALFAPDGEVVNPGQPSIRGRAAIATFLAGFAGYQVLEDDLRPESTIVQSDRATQTGTYHQRVRTPEDRLLEVSGHFQAEWVRDGDGQWLIQRMGTTPG